MPGQSGVMVGLGTAADMKEFPDHRMMFGWAVVEHNYLSLPFP
jgi:hypothetical protein